MEDITYGVPEFVGALVIITLIVAVMCWLAMIPGRIARERNHPDLKGVRLLASLGVFIWPLWIGAMIWACVGGKPKA